MGAMLRTAPTYGGFSRADGPYLAAPVPIDVAERPREGPGRGVGGGTESAPFGVCGIWAGAVPRERDRPSPPPDPDGRAPWSAVQRFLPRQLGRDGGAPHARGPNFSAGWPIHLLRTRMGADHGSSLAG